MPDSPVLGPEHAFVDPLTGEVILERPVVTGTSAADSPRSARLRPEHPGGFVTVTMEGLIQTRKKTSNPAAILLVLEAARQARMNGGGLLVTEALRSRLDISRQEARTAIASMSSLIADEWIVLDRESPRSAVSMKVTPKGLKCIWYNGR